MSLSRKKKIDSGSIKVAVRLRPLNGAEIMTSSKGAQRGNENDPRAWHVVRGETQSIVQHNGEPVSGQNFFTFDTIFDEPTSNEQVYDEVGKQTVDGFVNGLNATIFAYGQTGAGKSYTIQGSGDEFGNGDEFGIIQLIARDLFGHIENQSRREFLIRAAYMEIYNENVRDLLRDVDVEGGTSETKRNPEIGCLEAPSLTVRESPEHGGVYVNCREVILTDMDSMLNILDAGKDNRVVASTNMNERSSRSHSIFRITLESREKKKEGYDTDSQDGEDGDGAILVSTLNLVDLAGSESVRRTGSTGKRQWEGGKINQSLLTLSQVIYALSLPKHEKPPHINYRDSKLTRVLRPSLSGNALMVILCCATASRLFTEETRSTLKFASRAKLVKTKARTNHVADDRALIKRLQRELAEAKRALKAIEQQQQQQGNEATEEISSDARNKVIRITSVKCKILRGGENGAESEGTHLIDPTSFLANRTKVQTTRSASCVPSAAPSQPIVKHTMAKRRSTTIAGLLRIARHNDADVNFAIYHEDGGEETNGVFRDALSLGKGPLLVSRKEKGEGDEGETKEIPQENVSEVERLRRELSAKRNYARRLERQLSESEGLAKSLKYELERAETDRKTAQKRINQLTIERDLLRNKLEVVATPTVSGQVHVKGTAREALAEEKDWTVSIPGPSSSLLHDGIGDILSPIIGIFANMLPGTRTECWCGNRMVSFPE